MLNINIFGGPGIGKSTTAAKLFGKMKARDHKVEYIQEFAKELTFSKDYTRLSDQMLILGEQHHRMFRLNGQIDFLIHDSPFIMGVTYLSEDPHLPKEAYTNLVVQMFNSYDNINVFLERDIENLQYQEYGRRQTLAEAIQKDVEIKALLDEYGIEYVIVKAGKKCAKKILKEVKKIGYKEEA